VSSSPHTNAPNSKPGKIVIHGLQPGQTRLFELEPLGPRLVDHCDLVHRAREYVRAC